MPPKREIVLLFLLTEVSAFGLYYGFLAAIRNAVESEFLYLLYLILVPFLLLITIAADRDTRDEFIRSLWKIDWTFFVAGLFAWGYLLALHGFSPFLMFYEVAYIDELNFRFLIPRVLGQYISREMAVILQALLFMLLYANYLFFEPASYPGIYALLYLISMFAMGILYGAIAYLRKNIYLDLLIHQSLFDLIFFVPPVPGWIPYSFLPT